MPTIALVDDDRNILTSVSIAFEAEGYRITTYSDGASALEGFKKGTYEVLVATDIAARGLDIAGVTHVINYDIPLHPEDYVHRIGRTGRAEHAGDAFTLVTAEELKAMLDIERLIDQKVPRARLENFPYVYTALFDEAKQKLKPVKGYRTSRGYSFGRQRK